MAAIDGVPQTVTLTDDGEIRFETPPGAQCVITAGFEFEVPVRFDVDQINITTHGFEAGDLPSVPLVELIL